MNTYANTKVSYQIMKLDYQLDQFRDYGVIDLHELHTFTAQFNQLPRPKQVHYAWMLDIAADLWDAAEQPEY